MESAQRRRCNKRICITYIVTFVILFLFFSHLMFSNRTSTSTLAKLQDEVACLTNVVVDLKKNCKSGGSTKTDFSCITGTEGYSRSAALGCNTKEIQTYVDSALKNKFKAVLDDVYNMKSQFMSSGCNSETSSNKPVAITNARVNYAADELGARITHVLAKPIGGSNILKTILGLDFNANPPINLLRSSLSPGACFGFYGSKATVSIRLAKVINVEEIALTHVPKEMTPMLSVANAPKDFAVYGLQPDGKKELLGQWTYENAPKKRTQIYKVKCNNVVQDLVFIFNSNHGANTTCIYSVEVYGKLI